MTGTNTLPNYAVHPGTMLAEWLDENDMSQGQLATRLGRSVKNVNQIVNGVADVSSSLALHLETVTGVPARLWANMQSQYDLDVARIRRDESLSPCVDWLDTLPLSELRKRGYITATARDRLQQVHECLRFFGVSTVDAWNHLWLEPQAQYRQSQSYQAARAAIAVWLRIGELEAEQTDARPYQRDTLQQALPALRALSREPDGAKIVPQLEHLLGQAGVQLLFIPDVPGTRLYGATRWLQGRPVVQLSLRRGSDDQFWFTLFHELAHVLLHSRDQVFVDGETLTGDGEEAEADTFSRDLLIPPSRALELGQLRSLVDVENFANEVGVSPGVVVGRIHREKLRPYSWGARLKRRVSFSAAA